MTLSLRYYQDGAVNAVFDYWASGGGNPLVDLATGTGKSLVIAEIIRRLVEEYPNIRVLSLVHVKELVKGNADELRKHAPHLQVGVNSAGLNQRDCHQQILFAGIQSVSHKCGELGPRDLLIIDEAHLLPKSGLGRYHSLIQEMRLLNPDMRVLGLTATPYRLDSGRLDEGDGAIFNQIVYTYSIAQGVEDGYLSPLVAKSTTRKLDVSGVAKRGGEFVAGALEDAVNRDEVTQAACQEIVERGHDRRAWLVFACGLDHAAAVRDALRQRGISCDMVTGETPNGDRDRIVERFKRGDLRAIVNVNVLTTGFNVPRVDLLAFLRPTLSTSLYVQMVGRGSRLADGKADCLVLDFAGNVRRHGPVDDVYVKPGKVDSGKVREETVRAKECPQCGTLVGTRVYVCPECHHEWEIPAEPKHDVRPDTDVVLFKSQRDGSNWLDVSDSKAVRHKKAGSIDSIRIEYHVGLETHRQWVCLAHMGYAGEVAKVWWKKHGLPLPISQSLDEAIATYNRLKPIGKIQVRRNGKYWEVVAWRLKSEDMEKAS